MSDTVFLKKYSEPPLNRREILRYAGVSGSAPDMELLMDEAILEARDVLCYNVCFCTLPIVRRDGEINIGILNTKSEALMKNLTGCSHAVLFAATVGIGIDRLIARYGSICPSKALMLQAVGAERIESLCDVFCNEISAELLTKGRSTKPRFSPGYGDFPIEAQRQIFSLLDCPRKIGLSLNESMLMSPSKSVTAVIGVLGGDAM